MLDSQRAIATHGVVGTVGASSSGSGDTKVQTVDVPRIATNAVELGGELRSFIGAGAEFVTCRSREIIGSPRTDAIRRHVAWAVLMEFIIRAARGGYRMVSEPTELRPRMSGSSKVNNFHTVWANFKQMVALRSHL